MRMIKILLILFLSILVVFFIAHISIDYLFTNPTLWCEKTDYVLSSICDLYIPAFGIYLHFWCGIIVMILGMIQILPITRRYIIIHRILGNIYIVAAILVSIGGNIFIYTNGTSGGINMSIAFSIYKWLLFLAAIVTYIMARIGNIIYHHEWAIRLFALTYASLFYRVCYFILSLCGYHVTTTSDFYRPIDMILDWFFFLFPMIICELFLQKKKIYSLLKKIFCKDQEILQDIVL